MKVKSIIGALALALFVECGYWQIEKSEKPEICRKQVLEQRLEEADEEAEYISLLLDVHSCGDPALEAEIWKRGYRKSQEEVEELKKFRDYLAAGERTGDPEVYQEGYTWHMNRARKTRKPGLRLYHEVTAYLLAEKVGAPKEWLWKDILRDAEKIEEPLGIWLMIYELRSYGEEERARELERIAEKKFPKYRGRSKYVNGQFIYTVEER